MTSSRSRSREDRTESEGSRRLNFDVAQQPHRREDSVRSPLLQQRQNIQSAVQRLSEISVPRDVLVIPLPTFLIIERLNPRKLTTSAPVRTANRAMSGSCGRQVWKGRIERTEPPLPEDFVGFQLPNVGSLSPNKLVVDRSRP